MMCIAAMIFYSKRWFFLGEVLLQPALFPFSVDHPTLHLSWMAPPATSYGLNPMNYSYMNHEPQATYKATELSWGPQSVL